MKSFVVIFTTLFCVLATAAEKAPLEPPYTSSEAPPSRTQIERPKKIDDEGAYYYGSQHTSATYHKLDELPPSKQAFFLRFGTIGPYDIEASNGKTYKTTYSDKTSFVVGLEYERLLGFMFGKWTWKINSGITTEEGQGSFVHPNNFTPDEKFSFFVFPNTFTANYKMRFSDKQWVTPYFEAGPGYFTFIEYRDDGHHTSLGGAPVLTGAAGVLIALTAWDQVAEATMYEDYDVKKLWLDLQFRRFLGLDDKKDFSSNMISAGFGFAF